MQNVLVNHEMLEESDGGETNKQGHAVETISCQANNVGQFRQALTLETSGVGKNEKSPLHSHFPKNSIITYNV